MFEPAARCFGDDTVGSAGGSGSLAAAKLVYEGLSAGASCACLLVESLVVPEIVVWYDINSSAECSTEGDESIAVTSDGEVSLLTCTALVGEHHDRYVKHAVEDM